MRTILVTGASGFLGSNLITKFLEDGNTKVIAVFGRPEDKANLLPENENVIVYPCSDLFNTDFGHVDTLIHTAFSRGDNLQGLTASVEMTEKVIELVNNQDVDSIINISTQGLYHGLKPGEKVTEEGSVGPNTAYGLAKWAVENMLKLGCKKSYTNIRMASLSTNARFLDFFVDSVIANKVITITAPNQYASIMDVADAVAGIVSVVNLPLNQRETVYNLGPGVQHSILEYAQSANEVGKTFGFAPTNIAVDDSGKEFAICMDCSKIESQTGWKPLIFKDEMIKNMFNKKR
jgi:nucleoside-diphosphate-sugar epimerase